MKIWTEVILKKNVTRKDIPFLVMYLDTEITGDHQFDTYNCTMEMPFPYDVEKFSQILCEILTKLVYAAYGTPHYQLDQKPIKSITETNFDVSCINGVKGHKIP